MRREQLEKRIVEAATWLETHRDRRAEILADAVSALEELRGEEPVVQDDDDDGEKVECPRCLGTGLSDGARCDRCSGTGAVSIVLPENDTDDLRAELAAL